MKESGLNEQQLSPAVRWGAVVLLVVGLAVLAWMTTRAWNSSHPGSQAGKAGGPSPLALREAVEPPRPATKDDPSLPAGWTAQTKRVTVVTPKGEEAREIVCYTNTIGMEFVLLPAGDFMMGSPEGEEGRDDDEGPVHRVRISKPFYMGACEVTQAQWEEVMGNNPSHFVRGAVLEEGYIFDIGAKKLDADTRGHPVERVSWNDCQEFVKKLSSKEGAAYRLPTEAEWDLACRAGSRTPFQPGATISTDQANYNGNYTYGTGREGVNRKETMPVGSFPPTRSASATCTAMSASGAGTGLLANTMPTILRRTPRARNPAITACCAAVPGTTGRGTAARATAAGASRRAGPAPLGSAWSSLLPRGNPSASGSSALWGPGAPRQCDGLQRVRVPSYADGEWGGIARESEPTPGWGGISAGDVNAAHRLPG